MSSILAMVLALVLLWVVGAVVLMIISRLGLGLAVDGFGAAFIASAVITIVAGVINWLLRTIGISVGNTNWLGALISLVVAAVVLLISDRFVKGMKVNGFVGAIIAAISYGVIAWLLQWVIGLFV
jgi:putative membrane protein